MGGGALASARDPMPRRALGTYRLSATLSPSHGRRARHARPPDYMRMSLSADELEEFKTRYEHVFGTHLSDDEALDLADRLEELYRIVLRRSAAPGEAPRPVAPPWRDEAAPLTGAHDV